MESFRTMGNFKAQRDRSKINAGLIGESSLPRRRQILNIISLLVLLLVSLANSCRKEPGVKKEEEEKQEPIEIKDSLELHFKHGDNTLSHVDVFIYDLEQDGALEHYVRIEESQELRAGLCKGEKIALAVANCPFKFKLSAVSKLSTMEKLSFNFIDDNPNLPLMSGKLRFKIDEDKRIELRLSPIMSYVEIRSLSNLLEGYELLESPRVRLRNINANVAVFEEKEFRASEYIDYGDWVSYKYDIGTYSDTSRIKLATYPNFSVENEVTPNPTKVELECYIRGKPRKFYIDTEPIRRDTVLQLVISIDESGVVL